MDSLALVIAILFVFFTLIGILIVGNVWNPITLFCGLYALIMFFYSLHIFELYAASDTAVSIVLIGVCSFFGGAISKCMIRRKKIPNKVVLDNSIQSINFKLLNILNILALIYLCVTAVVVIRMLLSGSSMWYIRYILYNEDSTVGVRSSNLSVQLYSYFVWPWTYVIIPLSVYLFLLKRDKSKEVKLFLVLSTINIALFILITAGRISIIYYLLYFILTRLISRKSQKVPFKYKIIIAIFVVVSMIAINAISASRLSRPLIENAYLYVCGCIPFLSSRLQSFQSGSHVFTYGLSSFRGFFVLLIALLSRTFGVPDIWSNVIENCYTQDFTNIAPNVTFNAFSTLFYYFYVDFGMIGVLVLSFVYGFVSMNFYEKFVKKPTFKNLMLYGLIVFGLVFSMIRFQFTNASYAFSFIYTVLCFSGTRGKRVRLKFGQSRFNEK